MLFNPVVGGRDCRCESLFGPLELTMEKEYTS